MSGNKVIYLSDDEQEESLLNRNKEGGDDDSQFKENPQFNNDMSGGEVADVDDGLDDGADDLTPEILEDSGESNYAMDGGINKNMLEEKLDEDFEIEDDAKSLNSVGSSLATDNILELDPMYIRLTKFLQTGGDNNKNLAQILLDISNNFEKLNNNLENLSNKLTKISLQQ